MPFQKQDLAGARYHWTENEKDVYSGSPSRRAFDRFNGNQVLFLINLCQSYLEKFSASDGRNIEHKLLYELPSDAKSEITVFHWLKQEVFSPE
jgi:hypothetical protein